MAASGSKLDDMPTTNVVHQHTRLPSDSHCFRLLRIQLPITRVDTDASQLRGSLIVCDFEEKPEYVAISYVWGARDADSPFILIDGMELTVTGNCYQALLSLRHLLGAYTIWVDAICIDQDNRTEQAHQIAQMTDIYTKAAKVYIWLGPESDSDGRAMACIQAVAFPASLCCKASEWDLSARFRDHWRRNLAAVRWSAPAMYLALSRVIRRRSLYPLFERNSHPEFLKGHEFQQQHKVRYSEVQGLFSTDWLDRIWTYQEVMLSASPIILKGRLQIEWNKFCFGILTIESTLVPGKYKELEVAVEKWTRLILDREKVQLRLAGGRGSNASGVLHENIMVEYRYLLLRSFTRRLFILGICFLFLILLVIMMVFNMVGILTGLKHFIVYGCSSFTLALLFSVLVVRSYLPRSVDHRQHEISGLVYAILTREATIPKDYNFGVRSLLEVLLQEKLPILDSHLPDSAVYHDLTIHTLQATLCGNILVAAAIQHADGLPSWIPNWSQAWQKPFNVLAYTGDDMSRPDGASFWDPGGSIRSWHRRGATRGSSMQFCYQLKQPDVFRIRGTIVADITFIHPDHSRLDVEGKILLANRLIRKLTTRTRRLALEVFAEQSELKYDRDALKKYVKSFRVDAEPQHEPPRTPQFDGYYCATGQSYFGAGWRYFDAAESGKPEKHWETGIAMDNVEIGDRIVLLSGVSAPLIVRSCPEGSYRLISPVRQLDRAMTGKYWQEEHEYPYIELH